MNHARLTVVLSWSIAMTSSSVGCRKHPASDSIYHCPTTLAGIVADPAKTPKQDYLIVDVRTAAEYATGHIPKAINIPHERIAAELDVAKTMPIVLYCKRGVRSEIALKALQAKGYTNLTNFGGIDRWKSSLEQKPPEARR